MLAEASRLYKLIILYFLYRSNAEITNAVLSDFLLEYGYTDYFSIQETLSSLTEDEMVVLNKTRTKTYYTITEGGLETLEYFRSKLPKDTIRQINAYLQDKRLQIVRDANVRIDYGKTDSGDYLARCSFLEQNELLLEVALEVPDEMKAVRVCRNFQEKGEEIYTYLWQKLVSEKEAASNGQKEAR